MSTKRVHVHVEKLTLRGTSIPARDLLAAIKTTISEQFRDPSFRIDQARGRMETAASAALARKRI